MLLLIISVVQSTVFIVLTSRSIVAGEKKNHRHCPFIVSDVDHTQQRFRQREKIIQNKVSASANKRYIFNFVSHWLSPCLARTHTKPPMEEDMGILHLIVTLITCVAINKILFLIFRELMKLYFGYSGLILGLCLSNENRRYNVTTSFIGWAQT